MQSSKNVSVNLYQRIRRSLIDLENLLHRTHTDMNGVSKISHFSINFISSLSVLYWSKRNFSLFYFIYFFFCSHLEMLEICRRSIADRSASGARQGYGVLSPNDSAAPTWLSRNGRRPISKQVRDKVTEAFDIMGSTGQEQEKSKSSFARASAVGKESTGSEGTKMSEEILRQLANLTVLMSSYRPDLDSSSRSQR